ncbi:FIVAR domain-containing protein [Clostridium facile]|uniref:FIVAR domain-containing protein n=1 Tax=Clostridium facile TaxID=2763035 RepID=A0ABR7ISP6_9CLOT|nr:FIVAR domain-containing protein [Clostridium facile]MBC5788164.1 FIVAR domain-containing protein [Clostridium facile]
MNQKTLKNSARVLSFLLACILVLCAIPFTTAFAADADKEYIINDSSFDMDDYLAGAGDANIIKISANLTGLGETVIQQPVTQLLGWTKNFFEDVPSVRTIKDKQDGTLRFAEGVDVLVRDLIFDTAQPVVVEKGANVAFENCTFVQTPVNNGTIICKDCTFETGKIENNGNASYTGTTEEPENIAQPSHTPLDIEVVPDTLPYAMVGSAYNQQLTFTLSGTNKDNATVQAQITPEGSGLIANVAGNTVAISGTSEQSGEYTVTITAAAEGDSPVSKTIALHAVVETEYIIDDNSYDFSDYLAWAGTATTVKVSADLTSLGEAVIQQPVSKLLGWEKNFFADQAKLRTIKDSSDGTLRFAEGVDVLVRDLIFDTAQPVVVEKGANVTFENCTFVQTPVNNGTIICEDCTFETGKIENNGSAVYTGTTVEPENIGTEQPSHIALGMNLAPETLQNAIAGTEYNQTLNVELYGTNKDNATVQASVTPEGSGITAAVQDNQVVVSGKVEKPGSYTVSVTATADGDQPVTKTVSFEAKQNISVSLEGTLDAVTVGQSGYQNYLDVFVTDENGDQVNYYDYSQANPNTKISVSLSPEGSGMRASYLFDSVVVSGTPEKQGTYQVSVTVTNDVQTATSNTVDLRIYQDDKTLQERFDALNPSITSWDIEPYEISQSGNAVVPINLKEIYGSHESGLYATLGNNQGYATDTLTIPAGCDVVFENIKFYSSIQIIVEKGGSLTLKDSVAYGGVVVNGGTFSMSNYAALVDSLTLNDGSVLKNATVNSHGRYLTDGSDKPDAPAVVIVNGTVTALGNNTITGEPGDSVLAGQDALVVNGELVIPEGSVLTAQGGGDYAPARVGGNGVVLNNGEVSGQGKLVALGGHGYEGDGGDGITGVGTISVVHLESIGGDAKSLFNDPKQGGDAIGSKVIVTTENYVLKGGAGNPAGSAEITPVTANKSILNQVIEYAEAQKASPEFNKVIADVQKTFNAALEQAKAVADNNVATQKEVDTAWQALLNEIHKLGFVKGDVTSLEKLVETAKGFDLSKYVEAGQAELKEALAAAEDLLADKDNAMEQEIQPVEENLLNAMLNLRLKADKSILESTVSQANNIEANLYTQESYQALKTAVAAANAVLADDSATQKQVDAAVDAVKAAMNGLVAVDNGESTKQNNAVQGIQIGQVTTSNNAVKSVKTGDVAPAVGIAVLALASAAVVALRKKETN